jgi:multidrug efflux system membrane fusion protein
VKRGEVLFVIDPRPYRAELLQAEADVARALAQLDLAKREAKRGLPLLAEKVITAEEYDTRVSAAAQAKAELHAAKAAREIARLNLNYTEVRAPLDGRISRAIISLGDYVTGSPVPTLLTTLVSLDPIYVYFDCDEQTFLRYGGKVHQGAPQGEELGLSALVARANDEGFPFRGVVDFVDNRVEAATGTMRMRARLANGDRALTPGLFARVRLLGRDKVRTLIVDGKSVLTDQDRKYVYVVKDGRTARRNVKLGRTLRHYVIVTEGLAEGERVVVSGLAKVRPDMPVTPQLVTPNSDDAPDVEGKEPPVPAPTAPGEKGPTPERRR